MSVTLDNLAALRSSGVQKGITSVCSAHPSVIRAALRHGRDAEATVLIEATCNQVNHHGGYTGMTPERFAKRVYRIAKEENWISVSLPQSEYTNRGQVMTEWTTEPKSGPHQSPHRPAGPL